MKFDDIDHQNVHSGSRIVNVVLVFPKLIPLMIFLIYCGLLWRSARKEMDAELKASWDLLISQKRNTWEILKLLHVSLYRYLVNKIIRFLAGIVVVANYISSKAVAAPSTAIDLMNQYGISLQDQVHTMVEQWLDQQMDVLGEKIKAQVKDPFMPLSLLSLLDDAVDSFLPDAKRVLFAKTEEIIRYRSPVKRYFDSNAIASTDDERAILLKRRQSTVLSFEEEYYKDYYAAQNKKRRRNQKRKLERLKKLNKLKKNSVMNESLWSPSTPNSARQITNYISSKFPTRLPLVYTTSNANSGNTTITRRRPSSGSFFFLGSRNSIDNEESTLSDNSNHDLNLIPRTSSLGDEFTSQLNNEKILRENIVEEEEEEENDNQVPTQNINDISIPDDVFEDLADYSSDDDASDDDDDYYYNYYDDYDGRDSSFSDDSSSVHSSSGKKNLVNKTRFYRFKKFIRNRIFDAFRPFQRCIRNRGIIARRFRAFLLYTLHPFDQSFWECLWNPWWILFSAIGFAPYGIGMVWWVLMFLLHDKGDEYQVCQFVASFQSATFFTQGWLSLVWGAILYYNCAIIKAEPHMNFCIDSGPKVHKYADAFFFFLQITLVWLCYFFLPNTQPCKLVFDVKDSYLLEDAERRAAFLGPRPRGGRLNGLFWYETFTVVLVIGIGMFAYFYVHPEPWKLQATFYWLRTVYGLFSLPFVLFKIPIIHSLLIPIKATGYDANGRVVLQVRRNYSDVTLPFA